MVTTPWSENSPLQGITFPRGGSSGVENGLNNLSWETWVYELGPLRGQAHSFHSSDWGWNLEPPAWDRRSLLTGSSRGGPSRRDIIYGNHTLPGHCGAMRSSRTRSRRILSRTPGSRAIGGNAYRRSLGVDPPFTEPQPLSRQDVCSYIVDPWDVSCSKRQQLPLGTQEDLARQFAGTKVSSTLPRHVSIAAWPW